MSGFDVGDGMESPELVLCPLTLRPKLRECPPDRYGEILDAAVEHGYRGVALGRIDEAIARSAGLSRERFLDQFAQRGLSTPLVEAVSAWGQGQSDDEIDAEILPTLDLAVAAGAQTVVALSHEAGLAPVQVAARGFARVCERAAERGLTVSIEFFPWGGIPDIATAWQVVQAAGAENGGLVLDTWHWARSAQGADFATLSAIPADRIHVVQIDDAAPQAWADPLQETLHGRLLPGDGVAGIAAILRALRKRDARPLLAPEVFSDDLLALGVSEMAGRVARATRAVLAEAGWR